MSKYIILVSDSHRQTECLKEIREMYPNAYAYLHAGDSELPKQLTEGYACVQGNCDYYGDYEPELVCEVEDHRILLVHSQYHDVHALIRCDDSLFHKQVQTHNLHSNHNSLVHMHILLLTA